MLLNWSSQRNPESYDYKRFSNEPTMELNDWTQAYQWSTYGKEIVKHKYEGETIYCIPGNGNNKLSKRDCTKNLIKLSTNNGRISMNDILKYTQCVTLHLTNIVG